MWAGQNFRGALTFALVLMMFCGGCVVWHPDFIHPSPHLKDASVLKEAVIKKIPFAITRTVGVQEKKDGTIKADFEWEARGRVDWFDEFGFGSSAKFMRFVLFDSDGAIICGNEWKESSQVTKTCDLKAEHLGKPLSADIDYTYEEKIPGENDRFMSVGRVFYFLDKGKTGN